MISRISSILSGRTSFRYPMEEMKQRAKDTKPEQTKKTGGKVMKKKMMGGGKTSKNMAKKKMMYGGKTSKNKAKMMKGGMAKKKMMGGGKTSKYMAKGGKTSKYMSKMAKGGKNRFK